MELHGLGQFEYGSRRSGRSAAEFSAIVGDFDSSGDVGLFVAGFGGD